METCLQKILVENEDGTFNSCFCIELGDGKVGIAAIVSEDRKAIMFRKAESTLPAGSIVVEKSELKEGDLLMFCKNRRAALVLLESAARLVSMFPLE